LFNEYLKQPELVAEAIQDDWCAMGDMVRIIDGPIQIIDRAKQLVKLSYSKAVPTTLPSRLVLILSHSTAPRQKPTLPSGSVPPSRPMSSHTAATEQAQEAQKLEPCHSPGLFGEYTPIARGDRGRSDHGQNPENR
jgi:hypothetical protein